jgi:hypothetical protein
MTRIIKILCAIAASLVFPSVAANAVDDTTDPVLTDFTLTSSASIDTGPSAVSFAWTATATDNRSGVHGIHVYIRSDYARTKRGSSRVTQGALGDLSFTGSGSVTLPRYMPYGTYDIRVTVYDHIGNGRSYRTNATGPTAADPDYDLCAIDTPCQIVNAAP